MVSILQIRSTDDSVPAMDFIPGKIIADKYETVPEFQVWQGSEEEEACRQQRKRARQTRTSRKAASTEAKPKSAKQALPLPFSDVYGEDEIQEYVEALDEENQPQDEREPDEDSHEDLSEDDVPDMAAERKHFAKKLWPSKANKAKEKSKPAKSSAEPSSSSVLVGADAPIPADPAHEKAAGAPKVKSGTEIKFELLELGRLVYYPKSQTFSAFCTKHEDCRRSRTAKSGNAGQGRPLGALVAWLMLSEKFNDHFEHVRLCVPSYKERKEARELLKAKDGYESFSSYERPLRPGEEEEPDSIR